MAARGEILVATETFTTDVNGTAVIVRAGVTRVRAGHVLAKANPQYFKPIEVHYDIEDATEEPGRKRGERG